jgi:hypothetical protein
MGFADIIGKATSAVGKLGADDPKKKEPKPEEPTHYQGHEYQASPYSLARQLQEPIDPVDPGTSVK